MRLMYILDANGNPVPCDDAVIWGKWFEDGHNRRVAFDQVAPDCKVSTIFLGIDHGYDGRLAPILYETMVFGGPLDEETARYCTREEALAGHAAMVARVKDAGGVRCEKP